MTFKLVAGITELVSIIHCAQPKQSETQQVSLKNDNVTYMDTEDAMDDVQRDIEFLKEKYRRRNLIVSFSAYGYIIIARNKKGAA